MCGSCAQSPVFHQACTELRSRVARSTPARSDHVAEKPSTLIGRHFSISRGRTAGLPGAPRQLHVIAQRHVERDHHGRVPGGRHQHPVERPRLRQRQPVPYGREEAVVRVGHSLGQTGGPGRVGDDDRILGVVLERRWRQPWVAGTERRDIDHRLAGEPFVAQCLPVRRVDDDHGRGQPLSDVIGGETAAEVAVDQGRNGADPGQREETQRLVGRGADVDRHRIPRPDAQPVQLGGSGGDPMLQLVQRHRLPGRVVVHRGVEGQRRVV